MKVKFLPKSADSSEFKGMTGRKNEGIGGELYLRILVDNVHFARSDIHRIKCSCVRTVRMGRAGHKEINGFRRR